MDVMAMNFNQLEYFVAIIEQKSLSKAANKLFITQPALTLSMQNLEKEIGFPSIEDRTGRYVYYSFEN